MRPKLILRALAAATALALAGLVGTAAATTTDDTTVADTGWGTPPADPTPSTATPTTPVTNGDTGWG